MKKPTLQNLIRLQQHSQLLKDYANDLANQLIIEFDINEGHKIARFLKVSQGLLHSQLFIRNLCTNKHTKVH